MVRRVEGNGKVLREVWPPWRSNLECMFVVIAGRAASVDERKTGGVEVWWNGIAGVHATPISLVTFVADKCKITGTKAHVVEDMWWKRNCLLGVCVCGRMKGSCGKVTADLRRDSWSVAGGGCEAKGV